MSKGKNAIFYEEIVNSIPDLVYLVPDKLLQLCKILKEKYKLSTDPKYPIQPIRIYND